jgi:hypothetical protein
VEYRVVEDLANLPVTTTPVELLANYTAFQEWMSRSAPC